MKLPEHRGGLGTPTDQGLRAQLLLALLILSVFPTFLLTLPVQTHGIRVDLPPLPETIVPAGPIEARPYLLTTFVIPDPKLVPPRPVHELVVTSRDEMLMDGERVDVRGLRERLDVIGARQDEWVDYRPEANARYEFFVEVLAIVKRAYVERLRLDSRPFRRALDEDDSGQADRPAPSRGGMRRSP
ncbi:MAG TPA: biopolymer transporter ExbD [Allosphingosinicella sp.]|jgi:biopolymer transport protein ExbD